MSFQGRSYYNLLQMNLIDEMPENLQDWMVVDYRKIKTQELFATLQSFGVDLDPDSFLAVAKEEDSPENLTQAFSESIEGGDKLQCTYLIIFELWRRLLKEKQSLSVFSDELDYQILLFREGSDNDDTLQLMLADMENILDETVDEGEDPKEIFQLAASFLAHDLEDFIYEFTAFQIDQSNDLYASELVDGFYSYVQRRPWFDFLRVRLVASVDPNEAEVMMQFLLEYLQEAPDIELLFEVLRFLVYSEEVPLFYQVFETTALLIEHEEDFKQLLNISLDYFNSLDRENEEELINDILEKRKSLASEYQVKIDDSDLVELKKIVSSVPL